MEPASAPTAAETTGKAAPARACEPARTGESWISQRARLEPHRTALVFDGGLLTYAELAQQTRERASALLGAAQAARLDPGRAPRVALLAGTCPEYALWVGAALEAGVEFVPLNVRLSLPELLDQLEDCRPFLLLHDEAHAAPARTLAGCGLEAASFAQAAGWPRATGDNLAAALAHVRSLEPNRVANVMYTSGSTGRPKGVLQTVGNHGHSARNCRDNLGFTATDDLWGCITPLYHTSGLSILMRSWACGVGVRLYGSFDAAAVNDGLLDGTITCLSAVSYQIERLLDDLETRGTSTYPTTLRFVLQGGGPLAAPTLQRCTRAHMNVVQSFGMTETASQVVALSLADAHLKPGSSGRPLGGVELRIAPGEAPNDDPAPPLTEGRILLKSPTLAAGYLNQPERYARSFTANGWFDTGDLGHLDEDGYLYVTCRRADLIISGGENVYPAEVEAAVLNHPAVASALVVGIDDAVWGSVPVAVCVAADNRAPNDPALPDAAALREFCRSRLAAYKCPRHVVWVDALPYTASGKPRRTEAARLADQLLARDAAVQP